MLEPFVKSICLPQTWQSAASLSWGTAFSYLIISYSVPWLGQARIAQIKAQIEDTTSDYEPQDYRDSARKGRPNGGRKEAHGSYPRQEGVEGIARETHAAGATAVHRCRPGARTRPGSGGGAPN